MRLLKQTIILKWVFLLSIYRFSFPQSNYELQASLVTPLQFQGSTSTSNPLYDPPTFIVHLSAGLYSLLDEPEKFDRSFHSLGYLPDILRSKSLRNTSCYGLFRVKPALIITMTNFDYKPDWKSFTETMIYKCDDSITLSNGVKEPIYPSGFNFIMRYDLKAGEDLIVAPIYDTCMFAKKTIYLELPPNTDASAIFGEEFAGAKINHNLTIRSTKQGPRIVNSYIELTLSKKSKIGGYVSGDSLLTLIPDGLKWKIRPYDQ